MKKVFLVVALMLVCAVPVMSQTWTESTVNGTATQQNGAITQPAPGVGANGTQTSTATFGALPSSSSGEEANGNAHVNGETIVNSGLFNNRATSGSFAFGKTCNNSAATVSETNPGYAPTNTLSLSGSGSMKTSTYAVVGLNPDGNTITNGASAGTSTNGSFSYHGTDTNAPGAWSSLTGNGSTVGYGVSTVTTLGNTGYKATSSAGVASTACPVTK